MSEPTIGQMDLSIARFMGKKGSDEFVRQNYIYHKSWDWLHRAWGKFRDLKFNNEKLELQHSGWKGTIEHAICHYDILMAHKYLYNGIQWYKQQSNEQSTTGNQG